MKFDSERMKAALRAFLAACGRWLARRWYWLLAYAAVAAAGSFALNTYFIAIIGGYGHQPTNGITLMPQTFWQGAAFWFVASAVLFAVVGYARRVGLRRFGRGFVTLPAMLLDGFREGVYRELAFCLIGFAAVYPLLPYAAPWLLGVIGGGILALSLSPAPIYGAAYASKGLAWAAGLIGRAPARPLLAWRSVSALLLGAAVAHLAVFLAGVEIPPWGVALIFAILAVVCGAKARTGSARLMLMFSSGLLGITSFLESGALWADDGGFYENSTLRSWWDDSGTGRVLEISEPAAAIGGAGGAVGGAVGEGIGDNAANESDDDLAERLNRELFGGRLPGSEPGPGDDGGSAGGEPPGGGEGEGGTAAGTRDDDVITLPDGTRVVNRPLGEPPAGEGPGDVRS